MRGDHYSVPVALAIKFVYVQFEFACKSVGYAKPYLLGVTWPYTILSIYAVLPYFLIFEIVFPIDFVGLSMSAIAKSTADFIKSFTFLFL